MLIAGNVKNLSADDFIMLFAIGTYTVLIIVIQIVARTDSNLLPPGFDISTLTSEQIIVREYGSKLVLVVEQMQILTTWAIKVCMLIMYGRLTIRRKENFAIKLIAGYTAFTFVLMEILYLGVWCRPFNNYWFALSRWTACMYFANDLRRAVPTPNEQCNAATNHLITNAVFNISSDFLILAVALPMFIKTRLPLRKKAAIVGIFGLGSFVILCAILNKYYSFTQPFGSQWTFWYVRESSTAILTANIPYVWALLRRVFHFRALDSSSGTRYGYGHTYTDQTRSKGTQSRKTEKTLYPQEIDLDLLMGETEGIHREIEIQVTEESRHPTKDGSLVSQSSWAESWVIKESTTTTNINVVGIDDHNSTGNVSSRSPAGTIQAPPRAILKRSGSDHSPV